MSSFGSYWTWQSERPSTLIIVNEFRQHKTIIFIAS